MSMKQGLTWAVSIVSGLAVYAASAEQTAVVKKNRVNVRGQASQKSEVVTQLKKGETVTVLEEIEVKKPKRGDPAKWARIQLPSNTPVWVFAPYIETANKTVNIKRLNVRAGPGENFSVLSRLERGAPVKEIRVVDNWMEIEAPANASAFIAADLLEMQAPPVTPTLAQAAPTPEPAPTTLENLTTEPKPAPVVDATTAPAPAPILPVTTTPATEATPAAVTPSEPVAAPTSVTEPPPRRVVSREGVVIVSRSIQAPTSYGLENSELRRTINYLHSEDETLKLKSFAGRKVIVTGEELIDQRWINTPIIEVESIRLVP
jgi:SH3-like domain-containing protein